MFMKKFLIIVVISTLHIQIAHGMLDAAYEAGTSVIQWASKKADPDKYVLDEENKELYQSIIDEMNGKDISQLRTTQFPDRKDTLQTFEYTFARVLERLNSAAYCILQQSFIQDPIKQKASKLSSMIDVNWLIIPLLHDALAIRALQEQKNPKKQVKNTGSLIVDALLHKISLLEEGDRLLLMTNLLAENEHLSLEQQRKTTEAYLLSLSQDEKEKLIQKVSQKEKPKPIANVTNQINSNNSNSNSLVKEGAMNNSLGSESGKAIPIPISNPSPQINHNGNRGKSSGNYGVVGNSLGSENGEVYADNYHENGEPVTNPHDQVYYGENS